MEFIRHGDVLIQKIDSLPSQLPKIKEDKVLLEGEITGHAHRLKNGTVYRYEVSEASEEYLTGYIDITEPSPLVHEEHETIVLQPGFYRFYQQREWDELAERRVQD